MKFKAIREDEEANAAIDTMIQSFDLQDEPMVGCFWYDTANNELYGVSSTLAQDVPFYQSSYFKSRVKTGRQLHQSIWKKEYFRGKDRRFQGDYTIKPRGRVFEIENQGFVVFTGEWINSYPEVKNLIIEEFQLPQDKTIFKVDEHWDIGHEWSKEF